MSDIIRLDEEALKKAIELHHDFPQYHGKDLRLYIEGKGCDGFYYGVSFDRRQPEDLIFPQDDITLIIDPDSFEFCKNASITWVDDERGQGFLVINPNQQKFRGKFYKRKQWQEKLKAKQQNQVQP